MSFDANTLLNTDVEGQMSTKFIPIPAEEFNLIIDGIDAKEVVSRKNGETYRFLEVSYVVDDAGVRELTGMDSPKVRQSMILDFTDGGTIDLGKGKNVKLGQLREACNQNDPTRPWNFQMLVGQAVRGMIKHRAGDDGQVFAEVKTITKL